MIAADRLAEVFVEVAHTLVDEVDLIDFSQMLTTRTTDLVGVDSAGLLLVDLRGRLQLWAASDEQSTVLELFQVQADEGPALDCFKRGERVVSGNLDQAHAVWPRFAPRALAAGYRSVHAFPLRLQQQVIGALNLFSSELVEMDPADSTIVQALADVATVGLLQARKLDRSEVLAEQLQAALNSRVAIEQAKGALSQIHSCTPDQAFEILRAYCRRHRLPLSDTAELVTIRPSAVPELTEPARPAL